MKREYLKTHNYNILKTYTIDEIKAHGDAEFFYDNEVTDKKIKLRRAQILNEIGHHCSEEGCNLSGFHYGLGVDKGGGLHLDLYGYDKEGDLVMVTIDHIKPKSKGGSDELDNLQPMCKVCNEKKGDIWIRPEIEKEFLMYKESLFLKKQGFDNLCLATYEASNFHLTKRPWRNGEDETEVAVPLYQQAFDWIREKYNLEGVIQKCNDFDCYKWSVYKITQNDKDFDSGFYECKSFEEARQKCIERLINIIKNSK